MTLSNNAGNVIGSNGAPATLTNVKNTIAGAGTIADGDLTMVNQGVINANQIRALVINTGSNTITNSGTLKATSNGGLDIESNVSNSKTIEVVGTNAKVVMPRPDRSWRQVLTRRSIATMPRLGWHSAKVRQ